MHVRLTAAKSASHLFNCFHSLPMRIREHVDACPQYIWCLLFYHLADFERVIIEWVLKSAVFGFIDE
jgi:hypothetical protein